MNVPVDLDRFSAAGLAFEEEGGLGIFRLVVDGLTSPHVEVRVPMDGQNLIFYPKRSAAQRQVLELLGENYLGHL